MKIAPSILSVNQTEYPRVIKQLEELQIELLHLDVMDGKFVLNKTYDHREVEKINKQTKLIIDTHLMIENPNEFVDDYINAGSTYITFHYEAEQFPQKVIDKIKYQNKKAGISIKPNTQPEVLDKYLPSLDLILIMSVEPGKGGQAFIPSSLKKIRYFNELRKKNNYQYLIEVDGGINDETIKLVKAEGADIVVIGSYLMKSKDLEHTYKELLKI